MDKVAEFNRWRAYIIGQVRKCRVFPTICETKSPLRVDTALAKKVHEAKLDRDFELSLSHESKLV